MRRKAATMAETDRGFSLPKYGVLVSVRHQAKRTNDLVNAIAAKFGDSVYWDKRTGFNYIERKGMCTLFFKLHGNEFANYVEFLCSNIGVLREIKQSFPDDFTAEVDIKEGLL